MNPKGLHTPSESEKDKKKQSGKIKEKNSNIKGNFRFRSVWMGPYCTNLSDASIVLDNMGSTGNSAILRPILVSSPMWLRAPRVYSCSSASTSVSWGGGSMKSKWIRSLIPRDFSSNTTFPKLVLWISGMVVSYKPKGNVCHWNNSAQSYRWIDFHSKWCIRTLFPRFLAQYSVSVCMSASLFRFKVLSYVIS